MLYLSIKDTAKKLGFKYVWHCTGKFLVRWNDNNRSHSIKSISDLQTITNSLGIVRFGTQSMPTLVEHPQTSSSNEYATNPNKNWQLDNSPLTASKGLKIGFLNANSLKKHIWAFRQYLINDSSYDILGVAETRLGPEVDNNIIQIPGYSTVRQDRNIVGLGVSPISGLGGPMASMGAARILWPKEGEIGNFVHFCGC